jgi:hypothetical protein
VAGRGVTVGLVGTDASDGLACSRPDRMQADNGRRGAE